MAELGVGSVLDLGALRRVLEDFSEATGLATVAVDTRGIPVVPACAFTDFCQKMRADPIRSRLCHGCDAHGGLQSLIDGSPRAYRCHAGLVDFSVPITDGDKYVGAILCGQVRVPHEEEPEFITQKSSWRGDPELLELYDQTPTSSVRRIDAAAKTLLGLSQGIDGVDRRGRTVLATASGSPRPRPTLPTHTPRPDPAGEATTGEPAPAGDQEPPAGFSALLDALDAEDLASAFAEISNRLDQAFAAEGDVRECLAELEDAILEVTRQCAPRLAGHLTQMVQRHRDRRVASVNRYQAQLYFERLLGMVLDEVVRSRPHRRRDLRDLLNNIARHPNRALSLTEAAAATHWSPGHLSKLFKTVTGYTFVSYVTAWRLSRARLMLASTQMSVRKIAAELDFHQVNYFSRVFRAQVGMSPSEYRRQYASRDGRPAGVSLPAHHDTLLRA